MIFWCSIEVSFVRSRERGRMRGRCAVQVPRIQILWKFWFQTWSKIECKCIYCRLRRHYYQRQNEKKMLHGWRRRLHDLGAHATSIHLCSSLRANTKKNYFIWWTFFRFLFFFSYFWFLIAFLHLFAFCLLWLRFWYNLLNKYIGHCPIARAVATARHSDICLKREKWRAKGVWKLPDSSHPINKRDGDNTITKYYMNVLKKLARKTMMHS